MSGERSMEQILFEALALRTWRQRTALRLRWAMRSVLHATVYRVPGYRPISMLFWKAKRGGWGGVLEPPFNIMEQDRGIYDKRLRWHHWGVLSEGGLFRGYTPTRRTALCFYTTAEAWVAVEDAYRGRGDPRAWEALPTRSAIGAGPAIANQDRLADQFPNPETEERG